MGNLPKNMNTPKITKTADEITRVHDILDEILNNPEINKRFDFTDGEKAREDMIAIKRTLCWILGHDEGRWLEGNLNTLETALKSIGFELKKVN